MDQMLQLTRADDPSEPYSNKSLVIYTDQSHSPDSPPGCVSDPAACSLRCERCGPQAGQRLYWFSSLPHSLVWAH